MPVKGRKEEVILHALSGDRVAVPASFQCRQRGAMRGCGLVASLASATLVCQAMNSTVSLVSLRVSGLVCLVSENLGETPMENLKKEAAKASGSQARVFKAFTT